jgi:hypothetical protein
VFLIAAGFGTVYELYEWFADGQLGTHYQPDNSDTMTDTVATDLVAWPAGFGWRRVRGAWRRRPHLVVQPVARSGTCARSRVMGSLLTSSSERRTSHHRHAVVRPRPERSEDEAAKAVPS